MLKKIFKYTTSILTLGIVGLTLYIIIFGSIALSNNKLINIFGYSYGFVPTDSMDGTAPSDAKIDSFKKGSIVIVKFEDFNNLNINDVIVYKSKDNYLKVHRIIEKHDYHYVTKGDNLSAPIDSDDLVTNEKYQGLVIKVFNAFGLGLYLTQFRTVIFMILTIILLIMLIWQIKEIVKRSYENKNKITDEEIDKLVEERLKAIKDNDNYEK